jgi:(2R)-ethylmalonyl-CoA mutase
MTREVLAKLKAAGLSHVPVVVGGIIPPEDAAILKAEGVAAIYTPKDFAINGIIADVAGVVEKAWG